MTSLFCRMGAARAMARAVMPRRAAPLRVPALLAMRAFADEACAKRCNKCGAANDAATLQCGQCDALQPLPSAVDYYEVLDAPQETVAHNGWRIDLRELKAKWRHKMSVAHPDRLVNRPDDEQQIGQQQSSIVNKAYETLSHPLLRVLYLLERAGAPSLDEGMSLDDPQLLMEVLEMQETLAEAEDPSIVDEVGRTNQAHIDQVLAELDEAFVSSPLDTDRIRQLAVKLRYWDNIDKAVREWQPGQRVELHH